MADRLNCDLIDETSRYYDFSGKTWSEDGDTGWSLVYPDFNGMSGPEVCAALDGDSFDVDGWTWHARRRKWQPDDTSDFDCEEDYEDAVEALREYAAEQYQENPDRLEPMINYALPCPTDDAAELQASLLDTGLTVVLIDGEPALALQMGGMDCSWEICAAYVQLGYSPPSHYCELPRMAGRGESESDRRLMEICAHSLEVAAMWRSDRADRMRERIAELKRSA